MKNHQQTGLLWYEWGTAICYISLISSIAFYTLVYIPWFYPESKSHPHWLKDPHVEVYIAGAVQEPGIYRLEKGQTRGDLLTKAKPARNANLKRLKWSHILKDGDLLEVPALKMTTATLKLPNDKKIELEVPKGTKLIEIQWLYDLPADIDLSALNKKRTIKAGEVIKIAPKKKK